LKDEQVARVLEIGLGLFGILMAAATAALLVGRLVGALVREERYGEEAPETGSVPAERHQHVLTSSPR
jgi:hypothetical protein